MTDRLTPEQERELEAMEAGAEGRPVEADLTELARLGYDLAAARPTPDPGFSGRLDQAVEDAFPPEWTEEHVGAKDSSMEGRRQRRRANGSWADQLRRRFGSGRQVLLPATAGLASVLVLATAVVTGLELRESDRSPGSSTPNASGPEDTSGSTQAPPEASDQRESALSDADAPASAGQAVTEQGASSEYLDKLDRAIDSSGTADEDGWTRSGPARAASRLGSNPRIRLTASRKVAAAAQITLGTDPDGVQDVANQVIEVVDDHNGIVMDSSVSDGPAGIARAEFSLSIPSGQMESAISDLSGIADLRERTQETEDVTAPFNTTSDKLKTSRARIQGLLGELENAYTDEDRQRIERRLRNERWVARNLQQRMNRLEKRVEMTPVSVSVVTDEDGSDDSGWSVADAFDDAGHVLGVAAGVALIALAISIPIGLMVLIVLAINRAWVRRARNRALNGD